MRKTRRALIAYIQSVVPEVRTDEQAIAWALKTAVETIRHKAEQAAKAAHVRHLHWEA